jgi:hypothetical protein
MTMFLSCWFVNVTQCDPFRRHNKGYDRRVFPEMELAPLSILRGSVLDSPALPQGLLVQPAG